ncbi:MAG: metal ABC transporter ATP-binding protein [Eubacteriales bacterium]|nr:metal ABC transporter ATP-binding protein [Eubacteriales bacterium]
MKPLITCRHVDFGYENHDAVIDLNLEIFPGDYLCIVGENGSGKSTLIKGLMGLLKPTGGELCKSGELLYGGIGYLPQQTAAQRDFPASVREVVLSGTLSRRGLLPFYGEKEKQEARSAMERLGIEDLKDKCYRELSGGQQQRVLIARALCASRQMLILDEPITGLDPGAIQDFYHLIRQLNKTDHVAIVMVSHDLRNVIDEAGKILHLGQRTLFYGTAEDYKKSAAARGFLGGDGL